MLGSAMMRELRGLQIQEALTGGSIGMRRVDPERRANIRVAARVGERPVNARDLLRKLCKIMALFWGLFNGRSAVCRLCSLRMGTAT
jgi:hypothetical protein